LMKLITVFSLSCDVMSSGLSPLIVPPPNCYPYVPLSGLHVG
jgi:hypothetical protein